MQHSYIGDLRNSVSHDCTITIGGSSIIVGYVFFYISADARLTEHREAMAVIQSNGEVLWMPAAIFKSTCPVDIFYFPFDSQECKLKFGSWTYDGFKLDLHFQEESMERVSGLVSSCPS